MADEEFKPQIRPLGGTEYSWGRAVPGGTGITVLALLFSQTPDITLFQNALHTLQISHPILRSKLTISNSNNNNLSFLIPPTSQIQIKSIDSSSSSSSFHEILEHELNQNVWKDPNSMSPNTETEVFFATLYALQDSKWVLVFRVHTSVCDRTSAVTLLSELMTLIRKKQQGEEEKLVEEEQVEDEANLPLEDLIPSGKAVKPFWARGADLLGYSLNSFRFTNLDFQDVSFPRSSGVVRLQMNPIETRRVLDGCEARGIKLCGAIAAAALIAAYSLKELPDYQWEKYAVVTLVDCRKFLDPPLQRHNIGFYHSGILNTHDINGEAELWELASRCYTVVANAKNSNKHFSDISDLNYLMCKAIENPGLTPSTSMRTSFICVFEDLVIDSSGDLHQEVGLDDYVGCSAIHGVGPSIAVFDTIRNGELDCACVYPMPLHSREQMQKLIDQMKIILIDGCDLNDDGLAT